MQAPGMRDVGGKKTSSYYRLPFMKDAYTSLSNQINSRLIANSKPDFDRLTLAVLKLKLARNYEANNTTQVN